MMPNITQSQNELIRTNADISVLALFFNYFRKTVFIHSRPSENWLSEKSCIIFSNAAVAAVADVVAVVNLMPLPVRGEPVEP